MYNTSIENYLVHENKFIGRAPSIYNVPDFDAFMQMMPSVTWEGHQAYVDAYQKVWELAYQHIYHPTEENGFVSSYIDTAFNDCTFMWDSAFIVQFAKYAKKAFPFIGTLDNFYSKQHSDGFICREIGRDAGEDRFYPCDPTSTGPNIFAYTEWEYYKMFGDTERLKLVFPVLTAYYRWFRLYRTWQNGTYWNSGWGCGLDNSPRFDKSGCLYGFNDGSGFDFYHGFNTWLDACVHQVLSGKALCAMAELLGRNDEIKDISDEIVFLTNYINTKMWDDATGFYYDHDRYGKLCGVKTILAFWTLLADIPSERQKQGLLAHLNNEKTFKRPHRVPSLSADDPSYCDDPVYWQGAVWAPTNYMILQGLHHIGEDELAREIAENTLKNVVQVFMETGTFWEDYNSERAERGKISRSDFVGWTGLIPTAVLIEYIFGIHVNALSRSVVWNLAQNDVHGVSNLPIFDNGTISLLYNGKVAEDGMPEITVISDRDLTLILNYNDKQKVFRITGE